MGISFLSILRTMGTLALMVGLMFMLARFARRRQTKLVGKAAGEGIGEIQVIARRSLGQHSSIAVLRIGKRILVIGQSAHQINVLSEFQVEDASSDFASSTESEETKKKYPTPWKVAGVGSNGFGAWDAFLDNLREKTVRR